jgi:nicotinate phosphoribosyltransferase
MPMIQSLLDTDFYKFTMGQMVFHRYPDVLVRYGFIKRTQGVHLADWIDENDLRRELDAVRQLHFRADEIDYLRRLEAYGAGLFKEDYLRFLQNLTLPEYELETVGNELRIEFPGAWAEAIYWETMALGIVNELYSRARWASLNEREREAVYQTGRERLGEKIEMLRQHPDVRFSDFGTRRRFSREWQAYVVQRISDELPTQCIGTSNVELAMQYGLVPIGTLAHELFMVTSGVMHGSDEEIRASHNKVLQDWWDEYGVTLSVALTDTYGTDFFFRDMTAEQARMWRGLRQDSGDPINFAEKAILFYERHGIDPREKVIVFSDGLDVKTIVTLAERFQGRIKTSFGWGTNLTNDLGYDAISMVVKIIEANGHGTVKLSDNLAKAMGEPEDVERFVRIFEYTNKLWEECRY